ncbi:MAG: UDP-N-acetylmuramate:L-alanyl-gamma-D-glutamyl-meso-diaminopimelate ligase, partial [Syntrophobacteraceae bacterium]|nr:UDP-N-acetylmuramate:L-alanyl-gamma-D-glutamyl-meso-diaminopimelate ligase [Syntrophobacteraceae bacterium]
GTLATMLKEMGFRVVGSDQSVYPPMSTHLQSLGIPVCLGYDAENVRRASPDLVIIGNVIRRENPEAQYVLGSGIPYLSMPQAIERFFLEKSKSIVVSGTHGKSTTASLLTWVLSASGLDPSAFVGAFMNNWERSYRLGQGDFMVLEGDEYDTAFFDKVPKFIHYRPHVATMSGIEYDHADIYPDFESVLRAFERLVELIPHDGTLIVNADDPNCVELSRKCAGKVITYGSSHHADWRLHKVNFLPGQVCIHVRSPLTDAHVTLDSRLPGLHNVMNTLSVLAVAATLGLDTKSLQDALLTFRGIKRRQDVLGEFKGVLVIDDFAHHPTAVQETIHALRLFHPERRLIAAFEPRSNSSRRSVFQNAYSKAFDHADCICLKAPPGMEAIRPEERLDSKRLLEEIKQRKSEAYLFAETVDLLAFLEDYHRPGDLVLCMSNGSFDGLPHRFMEMLRNGVPPDA